MKNLLIIKNYFCVTVADKRLAVLLIISSLLSNGPYMFTSLLFSMTIKYLTDKNINAVLMTMSAYFFFKTFSKVMKIINYKIEKRFYNNTYYKLQKIMIDKTSSIDLEYFKEHSKSELLNIVNNDIKVLSQFGTWLSNAVVLSVTFMVAVVILCNISIYLMFVGVVVNGIVIYILNIYNDKYEKLTKAGKEKTDNEMGFFSEILNGLKEIRIFNIMSPIAFIYRQKNNEYIEIHDQQVNNKIVRNIISPTITMITEIILMIYACYNCFYGNFGVDTVLIIQSYFGQLFQSLSDFVSTLGDLRVNNVSIERFSQFISSPMIENKPDHKIELDKGYDISICNLEFGYDDKLIFNNFNLEIQNNSLNAIVGNSGAGKSTFFDLMLRFKDYSKGSIKIGNNELKELNRDCLSNLVTCVSQKPFMFHMSIYENLALVNDNIDDIRRACKLAEIDEFIMSLPNQYNTLIDESAMNLSGGQLQRLALARALLKNSKILLLDEITSALDEKLSMGIIETLKLLKKDHTIILISHKKKEYEQCDNIIKLI